MLAATKPIVRHWCGGSGRQCHHACVSDHQFFVKQGALTPDAYAKLSHSVQLGAINETKLHKALVGHAQGRIVGEPLCVEARRPGERRPGVRGVRRESESLEA